MKITTVVNESDNQEYVLIDDENGNFISMLKELYDAQQAELDGKAL